MAAKSGSHLSHETVRVITAPGKAVNEPLHSPLHLTPIAQHLSVE